MGLFLWDVEDSSESYDVEIFILAASESCGASKRFEWVLVRLVVF